jgi:hypothetical protein
LSTKRQNQTRPYGFMEASLPWGDNWENQP